MLYVQRNADGQLMRVEAEAYAESTESLPADHPDLQAWFAREVVAERPGHDPGTGRPDPGAD